MSVRQKTDGFEKLIVDYLKRLKETVEHSDASDELSLRPSLTLILQGLADALDKNEMAVITEPIRTKGFGSPDYKIKTGKDFLIGYVEAKGLSSDVRALANSEQIERYCASGQRLVLTNHVEFVLFDFASSEREAPVMRVDQVKLLDKKGLLSGKKPHPADIDSLRKLFDRFLREARPEVDGARGLAERMANIAHIIRDSISYAFENSSASNTLQDLHKAFQEILIPDLKTHLSPNEKGKGIITSFDDMYAQTIVYGLFAARCNHDARKGHFTRRLAAYDLPKTNPFLKKLFEQIAGPDIEDEPFCWAVDDLAHLLAAVDMDAVLHDFGKRTQREDPVVHFYETFLKEYDPKLREARGVYYTPEAVVSYIVRSVDYLLKTKFNRPKGLVDENTLILDPACGTGTFLYAAIDHIRGQFQDNKGKWSGYVEKHILSRLFGFELLMAPYAVAHMKLGLQLAGADKPEDVRGDWKYDFSGNERLGIYLTNTLEEAFKKSEKIFASWISDEAEAAAHIKRDEPIMVVLGNPPYSGHSANRSFEKIGGKKVPNFIGKLIKEYYFVDGKPLGEKNPKWLQDDYVKFIRFGQWRIEKTGKGILAFITNHGYLDNPTFRGMRQHLMNTFTDIYIIDLHGNAKKKEKCPDGSKDQNVFDIQQGVAIGIFIKEEGKQTPAYVHHAHLWGIRETQDKQNGKYPYLFSHDIQNTQWTELKPQSPFYLFTPQDTDLLDEYEKGWKITEIMPEYSLGCLTKRDNLTIDFEKDGVYERISKFIDPIKSDSEATSEFGLGLIDKDMWNAKIARASVQVEDIYKFIKEEDYRPFDSKHIFYHNKFVARLNRRIMSHMEKSNLAFITVRQLASLPFKHSWVTKSIADQCIISTRTKEGGVIFPLYLYPNENNNEAEQEWMLDFGTEQRRSNFNNTFIKKVEQQLSLNFIPNGTGDLKKTFGPEDVFNYMYAVLHSPIYRTRYAEFLKIDFPRLPLTSDLALFKAITEKGCKLVSLHLLEEPMLNDTSLQPNYPVKGDDKVEGASYKEHGEKILGQSELLQKGRVYINKMQYFNGVEPEVWNFHVGGYQVCQKWLKDRRGRKLSHDDITHYQKIVVALRETIKLMNEIDEAISEWPLK